jgi:hypothetical protein
MMTLYIVLAVEWLSALLFVAYMLREVKRSRERGEARLREAEASSQAAVAAVEAELARFKAMLPPDLVMKLELSDEEPSPDVFTASEQVKPLVSALSQQEQSLGGAGLTLTAAKVEPGSVRLTLSPVERVGSAERVRRVADEWNARGGPLPPGVTAARADVLAA